MKPCDAEKCGLWQTCSSPAISASGSSNPDLLVIGPAPYYDDDIQGGNFLGEAGSLLRDILKETGFDDNKLAFAQVVRCRPSTTKWGKTVNREPTAAEIKDCKPLILKDIKNLNPRGILLLGAVAFKTILGVTGINSNRGRLFDLDGIPVIPTFHPEQVLRDTQFLEYFARDIEQMYKELYCEKEAVQPADYFFLKDLSSLKDLLSVAADAEEMSFDLETSRLNPHMEDAQIVCVSFSFVERQSFIVPLHHCSPWFKGRMMGYAKEVVAALMESNIPKIAHNGKFDMTWLKVTEGITTNNFAGDTMLMQYLLTEQAGTHGLDWLAWRYTDMGGYDAPLEEYKKHHKEADPSRGGSYRNIPWGILAPYAGMDTDCTLRCYHAIKPLLCKG